MGLEQKARYCGNCKIMVCAFPSIGQHITYALLLLLLFIPGLIYKHKVKNKICYCCGLLIDAFPDSK